MDPNGRVLLEGVPKNTTNELFVLTFPLITSIALSEKQTGSDVELGEILVPDIESQASGRAEIVMIGAKQIVYDLAGAMIGGGATLISADGSMMLSYFLGEKGRLYSHYGDTRPLPIPPGKYFVAPGLFFAQDLQVGLRDAIRAGVDLENSGVPQLIVPEEGIVKFEFNAVECTEAARKVVAKRVSQCEDGESMTPAPSPK